MKLPTLSPFGQPRNSRELVIWGLAQMGFMTFRQLRALIRRSRGQISHQGTWKLLRSLIEDGQVAKLARGEYTINPEWIEELRRFCDIIEEKHKVFQKDEEVKA